MKWIDIHSHHFDADPFVLRISNILSADLIPEQLARPGFYSIGIHPRFIDSTNLENHLTLLEKYADHQYVVAIGESGIDHLTDSPMKLQEEVFIAMVNLSEKVAKPLIIHSVKSHAEIIKLHHSIQPKQPWIFHGFNQRKTISDLVVNEGIVFSFGAAILNEYSPASELLERLDPGTFFLETDMSEIPIQQIYERAAAIKSCSEIELKSSIYQLYKRTFHND